MRWVVFAGITGAIAAAAVFACSSSSSDDQPSADAGKTDASSLVDAKDAADTATPLPFPLNQVCAVPENDGAAPACRLCRFGKCCDTSTALDTDAGNALADCVLEAGNDTDAHAGCFDEYPGQGQAYVDQIACVSLRCYDECGPEGGLAADPCEQCQQTSCIYDEVACLDNVDCFLYSNCISACSGVGNCLDACGAKYPQAPALALKLAACAMTFCSAVCN